jgi:hypothetical protein
MHFNTDVQSDVVLNVGILSVIILSVVETKLRGTTDCCKMESFSRKIPFKITPTPIKILEFTFRCSKIVRRQCTGYASGLTSKEYNEVEMLICVEHASLFCQILGNLLAFDTVDIVTVEMSLYEDKSFKRQR